ncbi:MAG: chromosome segregation protein SMC [Eggerthellaceae bacterium]
MYLKSLALRGFKSFADASVLSLEPGITAIVGPNGSGKSNILDAVLWVLGERNARNLRGQEMEDVIFAGSSTRKPVNIAEVELVLDNSDQVLPIDFEEVSVARRMYRSGESEYLINGTVCRRMDVLDLLHDSGLGTGTHSIISQGHLDAVLQSKPEDRRSLIEEAAGVLKHKQRKEKSARKLERMQQHLLRVQDVTAEVERQLKPLERKAKKARRFQQVSAELSDLSLRLAVDDLRALRLRWNQVLADEERLKTTLNDAQLKAYAADSKVRDLQHELQEHQDATSQASEGLHRLRSAGDRLDSTALLLQEKRRSVQRTREDSLRRLEDDMRRLSDARQEREVAQANCSEAKRQCDEAQESETQARDRNDREAAALAELQQQISRLAADEQRLTAEGERLRNEQAQTADALSNSQADEKLLAARSADLDTRQEALAKKLAEAESHCRQIEEQLAAAEARSGQANEKTASAFSAVDKARQEAEEIRVRVSKLEARLAGLQEAEDTRRQENKALSWMRERMQDFHISSALVEAVRVPEELSSLVDYLLGSAQTASFVPAGDDARRALEALSESAVEGQAALLATDEHGRTDRPAAPAGSRYLLDMLTVEKGYEAVFDRLLGNVLVCDSWDQAARVEQAIADDSALTGRFRVATAEGYVYDEHGVHRFMQQGKAAIGTVERHRRIVEADEEHQAALGALKRAEEVLEQAQEHLRASQKEGVEAASALAEVRGRSDSGKAQLEELQSQRVQLEQERSTISQRREDVASVLDRMRPASERTQEALEKTVAQLAQTKAELSQLRERLAPVQERATEAAEAYAKRRMDAGVLSERATYAERLLLARDQDIKRLQERISRTRTALESRQDPETLDPAIAALSKIREAVTLRMSAQERGMDKAKNVSEGIHSRIDEARRHSHALHAQMDDATARLSDLRVEKGRLEVQVEAAVKAIEQDRATPIDRALELPPVEDREQAQERADVLRRRIANMGTINPDAAEEYEQLKERFDYLQNQVNDLVSARDSLRKIAAVIDDRMRDDFIDTYHQVNENFQEIFAELFPGGSASLSLVNENDPEHSGVEVQAQPKGKRIDRLSLMSGGEKSLTALALLFAVYKTRATPFYILDEVEAALDDSNLRRLCAYWDKMRASTQLIIITHQRRTMEMADVLYGISMQSDGVTKLLSQRLDRARELQGDTATGEQ